MVMTSVELKRKLEKLNTGILKTEAELNDLQQQQIDCTKKQNKISGLIGIANRKFDDKKKMYFRTQIELDTRISEEKARLRQVAIDKKKKQLPTFETWLKKEFKELVSETSELGVTLGTSFSESTLYDRYIRIRDDRFPTRESVILNESINRYDEVLTSLIEKELDGGQVGLMEKRNLKQSVVNFLNNQVIKSSLQI